MAPLQTALRNFARQLVLNACAAIAVTQWCRRIGQLRCPSRGTLLDAQWDHGS